MLKPAIAPNESQRLFALKEYSILDTLPEQDYDDITRIASEICGTPISLVTLVDSSRQWFMSNRGLNVKETPRDHAFCAHAINTPASPFIVKDARLDNRFFDNPLVTGDPNVIFYLGIPLVNPTGYALGTLCVIDNVPRELNPTQIESLQALSRQVVNLLELRKANRLLEEKQQQIEERNRNLHKLAYVVSHDLKSPVGNIISLTGMLKDDLGEKVGESGELLMGLIETSSRQIINLIDGIVSHYVDLNKVNNEQTEIALQPLFKALNEQLNPWRDHKIGFSTSVDSIYANAVVLRQVLANLITNAIKYNDKEEVEINITALKANSDYMFTVSDNGIGIDEKHLHKIFETFVTLGVTDRFNNRGTGIGLATVKEMLEKCGGTISVESTLGRGSVFTFTLPVV